MQQPNLRNLVTLPASARKTRNPPPSAPPDLYVQPSHEEGFASRSWKRPAWWENWLRTRTGSHARTGRRRPAAQIVSPRDFGAMKPPRMNCFYRRSPPLAAQGTSGWPSGFRGMRISTSTCGCILPLRCSGNVRRRVPKRTHCRASLHAEETSLSGTHGRRSNRPPRDTAFQAVPNDMSASRRVLCEEIASMGPKTHVRRQR